MKKRRSIFKYLLSIFTICLLMFALLVIGTLVASYMLEPPPLAIDQQTTLYNSDGEVIAKERGIESSKYVPLEEISPHLIESTIAVEDRRFYEHHGFDYRRIISAILLDLKTLSLKEGASTLTQQYARNLYLSHEKTWMRKLKEAFYTIRLEMHYTKDEILEGYLNTIYFGHGAYGIESASSYYFDKHASDLTLAEAAMLAGIPKGPTYYSPVNDEERATNRQHDILRKMKEQQKITEEQYMEAVQEELVYAKKVMSKDEVTGPYFQDAALQEAAYHLELSREDIRSGGYEIYTTLDSSLQEDLEKAIKDQIKDSEIEVGSIVMDPESGEMLALVGGRSYDESSFNRAISAKRMPGSTFKPILYYAALENNYTPSTRLISKPTSFVLEDGNVYEPKNFNGYYANEAITLAQALAVSDNIYAVKTNLFMGPEKLVEAARRFGIKGELPKVASLALGTAAVSVKEMVTAFAMIANGEEKLQPYTLEKVVDRHGKVVYERKDKKREKVLDRAQSFILTHLMTGMFDDTLSDYMSVTGASIAKQLTRPYAGKSGTTDYDSWMIGYSPSIVTGVWTGYDDNRTLEGSRETSYAKEIWASFMEDAHEDMPPKKFVAPSNVKPVAIDPKTGDIATPYCPVSKTVYFKEGTEPKTHCTTHLPGDENEEERKDEDDEKGILKKFFDFFL